MKYINKKWLLVVVLLTAVFLTVSLAFAGGDLLPRSLVSSGGGLVSQSGYSLHSAIGQPVVGAVQNEATLCSGYLCGADAPPVTGGSFHIYLPVVIR
ncbi:MAG TPA: hypothetical protein PLD25_07750 [Chloroflexota bacterium]|nr:hypothetical protein [Chloroflexota bacterium]